MPLITCYAKLFFYFSVLRPFLPCRDTYMNHDTVFVSAKILVIDINITVITDKTTDQCQCCSCKNISMETLNVYNMYVKIT